jgi:mono/diheme cytochrome c family protein
MRKLGLLLAFALVACSSSPAARLPLAAQGSPVLEVRGAVKGGPFALGRADVEKLPRLGVVGVEPETRKRTAWEGTSVAALVSERVEVQRGADTVIVRTGEGAAVPVPLTMIRQMKPVLADRADGARLATRVLAWPADLGIATDPRSPAWWARDPVAFELVSWQRTYGPALATPEAAADGARRGADVYVQSCISCHRMRGVGGERGPDLTTVAARLRPGAFATLLTGHPGWKHRDPDLAGTEAATDLWAFLRTVALAAPGSTPDEDLAAGGAPVVQAQ